MLNKKCEYVDSYKGYDFIIGIDVIGFRVGYIRIPGKVKQELEKEINEINSTAEVCFDFIKKYIDDTVISTTFKSSIDYWIGFACNHLQDLNDIDSAKKLFNEPEYIEEMSSYWDFTIESNKRREQDQYIKQTIKTKEFCITACKKAIDQMITDKFIPYKNKKE